jgi:nitric oxide reductase activation protein
MALQRALPRDVVEAVGSVWFEAVPVSVSARESLQRAVSRERIPPLPDWFGIIDPRKLRGTVLEPGQGASPTADDRRGQVRKAAIPELEPEDGRSEESQFLKRLSSPLNVQMPMFRLLKSIFGLGRKAGRGGAAAEVPVGNVVAASKVGANARLSLAPGWLSVAASPNTNLVGVYPEWDVFRGAYRPDWCRVFDYDSPAGPHEIPVSRDRVLHRSVARIGLTLERHRRQEHGDALDLDALVGAAIARAAGTPVDPRVHERRIRTAPALGVLVLLDASGSTGESRSTGRRVFDDQRQIVANLATALHDVGHRVAVYGFNSQGAHNVRFIRISTFNERFVPVGRRRLHTLEPSGLTRMGTAIRHASRILRRGAGVERQVLVVVSDGFPYDDGGYEGTYAEADSRRALSEARADGVACVCLNFASSDEDGRLARIFDDTAHVRLSGPGELPGHVEPLFVNALRQRTSTARNE